MRLHWWIIPQLALGVALAAPPLSPALVTRTDAAVVVLTAEADLSTRAGVRRIEQAMQTVRAGLDAYFHAPNLKTARADAATLRTAFVRLRQQPTPVMLVVDDVLRFNPALHDGLAEACERLADTPCARRHRLAALATAPSPARIAAARRLLKPDERAAFDARFRATPGSASPPE